MRMFLGQSVKNILTLLASNFSAFMAGVPEEILNDLQNKRSEHAFEVFFRYYYSRLVIWANSIIKDPQAAEDIIQDFFLDFWQNKRYDSVRTDLTAYCYRVVRNAALRYLSRKVEITEVRDLEDNLTWDDRRTEDLDVKQRIYLEIDNLPEKCREVFIHCVLYGKTYRDVAEDLGVSINTVRTHMTRAYKILRERLAPVFGR